MIYCSPLGTLHFDAGGVTRCGTCGDGNAGRAFGSNELAEVYPDRSRRDDAGRTATGATRRRIGEDTDAVGGRDRLLIGRTDLGKGAIRGQGTRTRTALHQDVTRAGAGAESFDLLISIRRDRGAGIRTGSTRDLDIGVGAGSLRVNVLVKAQSARRDRGVIASGCAARDGDSFAAVGINLLLAGRDDAGIAATLAVGAGIGQDGDVAGSLDILAVIAGTRLDQGVSATRARAIACRCCTHPFHPGARSCRRSDCC